MRKKLRSFLTKVAIFALFTVTALGMAEPITAKAWDYSNPSYPNGEENNQIRIGTVSAGKVHNGWTMLDYANASSYWGVGSGAITSDPTTDYWNGNPVVYKYGVGSKIYFADNENLSIQAGIGTHTYTRILSAGEEVPVWYWEAVDNPVACHNSATGATDPFIYKGFTFRKLQDGLSPCERVGDSTAWAAHCAVCGEEIGYLVNGRNVHLNVYASANAVADMPSITIGNVTFVYSCRICGNMETGADFFHKCLGVSTNQYNIVYNKNNNDPSCYGYTAPQTVYYKQNASTGAAQFNGENVTGALAASTSQYKREGYVQVGWNTKPDGSGISIALDGSLVINAHRLKD